MLLWVALKVSVRSCSLICENTHIFWRANPHLGVEVIWEFQEFQELQTSQSNFKRRKRVAKIKRRKMFDRRAFFLFRTQSPHAQ